MFPVRRSRRIRAVRLSHMTCTHLISEDANSNSNSNFRAEHELTPL